MIGGGILAESESILQSIKKNLGIMSDYGQFDPDIIMYINTTLNFLDQFGAGKQPFHITGADETWADFLGDDEEKLNLVKTYVTLKVRMIFDPPASSAVSQAYNETLKELEFRIISICDYKEEG